MVFLYLLLGLAAVFYYLLRNVQKKLNYWKERGVTQLSPDLLYGDMKDVTLQKTSEPEKNKEFYHQFKKMGVPCGGVYLYTRPKLIIVDPKLIKQILFKDFQYFSGHNPKYMDTLLFNNIFHMSGEEWKDIRRKLTPTFTSGKMKMMFNILADKSVEFSNLVSDMIKSGQQAEFKGLLARFTTDVIGSCGFGIECDSIHDESSVFYQAGQEMFRKFQPESVPKLFKVFLTAFGLRSLDDLNIADIEDFFRKVVNDTVSLREANKIVRKDFLHLMIQLKNKGSITDIINEKDVYNKTTSGEGMSMEEVTGQCMLFFTAGFETTSTTMSFAFLELAQNQDIQEKLRQEVRRVLNKHDGKLTYEALQDMTYLENVINETLRKYPPVANLPRLCTKNYRLPDSDAEIERGTIVEIPLLALQNDPEYFPNPEKFDPERFNEENKGNIVDCTYLPFGDGPRQCLGLRFGMMNSKTGIASLINRFKFTLNKKTTYPPKLSPTAAIISTKDGIWLNITEAS